MNFNLWFQIVELRDIWDEAILELKSKNKLNESLHAELESWNSDFDAILQTSGVNWVHLAMLEKRHSVFSHNPEAFATIMSEVLTDTYMCMKTGKSLGAQVAWRPVKKDDFGKSLGRQIEKGDFENIEDDESLNVCKATKETLKTMLQKPEEEKTAWFTAIIRARLKNRDEDYFSRNRPISKMRKNVQRMPMDQFTDPEKFGIRPKSVMYAPEYDGDEERTLGDEDFTKLRETIIDIIKDKAARSKHPTADIWRLTLDVYDKLTVFSLKTIMNAFDPTLKAITANRILELLKTSSDEAKEKLGITRKMSPRHQFVKRPGAGKRAIGG